MNILKVSFLSFVVVWAMFGVVSGQEHVGKIWTDYPILKKGAFANHSYPAAPILMKSASGDTRRLFDLVNGVFRPIFDKDGYIKRTGAYLTKVDFVDITGDGRKEAIAYILPLHSGNAVWYGIYIFSMDQHRPARLLWSFATGDRGVGGLKRIYGKKGHLVVELWGWNSGPDSPPTSHIEAQAGSSWITRRQYRWNGNTFIVRGIAKIFEAK